MRQLARLYDDIITTERHNRIYRDRFRAQAQLEVRGQVLSRSYADLEAADRRLSELYDSLLAALCAGKPLLRLLELETAIEAAWAQRRGAIRAWSEAKSEEGGEPCPG